MWKLKHVRAEATLLVVSKEARDRPCTTEGSMLHSMALTHSNGARQPKKASRDLMRPHYRLQGDLVGNCAHNRATWAWSHRKHQTSELNTSVGSAWSLTSHPLFKFPKIPTRLPEQDWAGAYTPFRKTGTCPGRHGGRWTSVVPEYGLRTGFRERVRRGRF